MGDTARIYLITDRGANMGIDVSTLSSGIGFESVTMTDWIGADLSLIDWDKIGTK